MSEVQSRPSTSRGRGSHRGGRGGYRGGRGASKNSKSDIENQPPTIEDQGEIGALKKKHGSKVSTVRELFPDWTEEDVVYALEETGGDLESTVERITIGRYSHFCVWDSTDSSMQVASANGEKLPKNPTDLGRK